MLRVSQAFAPVLAANGGGALLNVASVASWVTSPALAGYAVTKSAAWSLTNGLRNELRGQKTQVLTLHMAFVDTDMTQGIDGPKSTPEDIVARALDALEAGADEVLADERTQQVKPGCRRSRRVPAGARHMSMTAAAARCPARAHPARVALAGVLGRQHRRLPGVAGHHDAVRGLRPAAAGLRRRSAADLSWVLNAYTVVYAAMLIPAGGLADTHGRKRVFLFGVTLFLAASAACGLAGSVGWLVAARVLQAVGAALLTPASLSIVLAAFPQSKRAVVVSLWGAVGGLAAAVGPSLGSFVIDQLRLALGLLHQPAARRAWRCGAVRRCWPSRRSPASAAGWTPSAWCC